MGKTNIFDRKKEEFANAGKRRGGDYLRPCNILARIDSTRIGENRKGHERAFIEMTVLKNLDPDNSPHPVGANVTHCITEESDYFLDDILGFIGATLETNVAEYSEQEKRDACEQVFGGDNPLAGEIVEVMARNVVTKNNKDFTRIDYRGRVPAKRALQLLDPEVVARFFEDGYLENLAERESKGE